MAQNIDFSGSDQIQTPQYPDVHPPFQEKSEEVSQVREDLMKSIETYLEKSNCIPFEEKPLILLQAWFKFFAIQYSNPKNPNKLFQKLLEDLKELAEYENSKSRDRPIFLNNDENHSDQYKESFENSSKEIVTSNSNKEKEEPPQEFDIHQLIEEYSTKICKEQKQSMEETMLELVKICQEKEFLCIHDNVEDLIESALNSKLLLINLNSQHLEKEQEVKNVVEQPTEHGNRIESLQNFRVIHKSSISLNYTSQISSIHAITLIMSTNEPEHSLSMGYEHLSITPETKSDEVTESNAENLLPIPSECEDGNSQREEIDIVTETDDVLPPSVENDDDSSNDSLLEEAGLFLASDNSIPPGIENFTDDSEGDICFLEELLIDDSILSHESSDSNFEDNPSIPRPPPEPPDAEINTGEEIPVVMNDKDENDDYFPLMFVI
nr:hypothetical protein [Tanacetum cinerariifolium]